MKFKAIFALTVSAMLSIFSHSFAATYYWDVNGTTAGFSTVVGAWNGSNLFWNTDATGGAGSTISTTTSGDDLIIKPATTNTGSITVSGTQSASSITFAANVGPTTTLTGGAITIGGTGASSGIFQQSSGANTISTALTLKSDITALNFSNSAGGLLTIGAVTGAATSGTQTINVGASSTGGITLNGIIGNGAGGGRVALNINSSGSGVTTLSGASTFTGGVTMTSGTASFTSTGLGTGKITFAGNSTLQWGAATTTDLSSRLIINTGATATLDTGANSVTFASVFGLENNSKGTLNKIGSGTLTLSNAANQFAGNIVITNGKVALGNQYGMWQSAYDTTGSTGAIGLTATGQATPWLGGVAGSVNLATAITGYASITSLTLNPQLGSSVSYGGVIANGAANMTLNKTGHGTQTLTGTNTYSGATTVWAGTLGLAGASGSATSSAFTVRGGTLLLDNSGGTWVNRISDSAALSLGSLTLNSDNGGVAQLETVGATTFAVGGKVTINNGTGAGTTLAMGGVTRSAGAAIDFVGTGGTLGSGASNPNVTATSGLTNTNGILGWATVGGSQWAESNSNSIRAYSGSFTAINSSTNAQNAQVSGSETLSGARVGNSLNLIATATGQSLALGANNLTLGSAAGSAAAILKSGTDAYTISGTGQVRAGSAGAGTELIAHVNGGALTISAPLNTAIVGIAKGGTGDLILSGTRAGTLSGAIGIAGGQLEFQGSSTTLSGVVSGAGGLTVNLNAGQTLTMGNNSNSYSGPTIVKGGYLAFPAYNLIGMPGGLTQTPGTNTSLISSNLILEGGVFNSSYVFNKDLGAGPGQVQVLAGTSGFVNTASQGGASGFTLDGGREIVWGSTYFNPTVFVHSLNSGNNLTLNLANGFDLNGSTRTVLVGDATYNSTVGVSQLGGNIRNSNGTAGFTKTGTGTLLLSGTNTYNGVTTVSNGILRFSNRVSLYNATTASWTAANMVVANSGTLALNVGGAGQFTTSDVTTLLTNLGGANGTSTTGFAAGSSIGFDTTNASGSTFTVADNIANSSGAGGGAMGVAKLGTGTLVLSGTNNSYSGATIIRGGTLSLTGSLTGGTAITTSDNNNGGGGTALQGILSQGAASVISGAASLTQGSTGTSILLGDNSYTGGTTLNAGTLSVGHANALGTGTGTIALNGGTIQSNNTTARIFTNPVTIGGNFTVGGTGNMTFSNTGASALGTTRQITVNTGINATFAQAFSGAGGLTKAGAGNLKLTGNNSIGPVTVNAGLLTIDGGTTSTGTFALPNASVSIINGGTLSTSSGSAASAFSSGSSITITGGDGVTSTWNLNGGAIGTVAGSHNSGTFMIDGAGYEGSARVTNVSTLTWGRTLSNATLTLTNGGRMNVTGEIRTGVTYYNTTGNTDIIIGGGTATSTFTGNNQTFTIGYAERNGSKNNDVIVNSGGVLTGIGNMFVGHVLYGVALGTSTNNKLAVNGTGTASMASVTVGYGQINVDQANANLLEVTSGGTLTTSATNYIGRAEVAGSTTNANTATVTGTGSSWNAGNQNVLVGFTNNATATSNNNIFTVSSGGSVTGINGLTIGSGTGTETGNQLVVDGGTLTTAALTVQTSNTASVGGANGLMTVNGAFTGGGSATITGGRLTVTGSGTKNLPVTINGGDFRFNGSTNYTGTLSYTSGTISGTNWAGSLSGLTIGANQTISPGNSPGTAATAAQTWASGGTYQWEINNTAGTKGVDPGWDWLNASGVLDITATSGSKFNIDISGLTTGNVAGAVSNWNAFTNRSWIIATGSSVTNFAADKFNLLTTNFANNNGVNTPATDNGFAISQSGNDIILGYTGATTGYWDTNGSTAGAGGATPSGTWSTGAANWSSDSTGSSTTSVWGGTNTNAVFSAGTDATDSYDVTISGGVSAQNITFDKGTVNVTGGTLTLVGTTPTITVNSTSAQISSVVDGTVGLTKAGTGTLILTGTNTYTGATTINNGILQLSGSGSINGSDVTVNGGSFINNSSVAYTGTLTLNNASLGGGTIDGDITYSGGGTVSGSSSVTGSVGSSSGSFSVESGANLTVGTSLNVSGTAELVLASTASVIGSINYSSSANSTIEGVIAGTDKTLTLNNSSAVLTLTGTNTYTGATNVNSGKLVVNGNISSSSLTSVASGATIGGSGTVGDLTVSSGGFINPGNSPGILNVSGDYTQAGLYTAEITGLTAGTEHDQINVTGSVDITGGSLTALFTAGTYAANDLIFILLNDGDDAITGTYSGFAQGATVIEYDGFDWKISYTANSTTNSFTGGNDIALMAIPEPKAALLGGLGLLLLLRRRR